MATLNPAVTEGAYTTTLKNLRDRVLIRLGFAAQLDNPPPGMAALVDEFLSSAQVLLAQRLPELITERFYTWTMVAGTRFYTVSGDDAGVTVPDFILDPLKITWIGIEDLNGAFYPLKEGIDPTLYATESKNGFPRRYELRQSLEVFPAPAAAYKLQVKGRPKNFVFTSDSDVATIDPELIFLLALGNAKSHYGQADAQIYFTQVTNHLGQIVAGSHGTKRYVPGATEVENAAQPSLITFIPQA